MLTNDNMNKRELSLIDLCYFILKEWRKLIIAMIVGAIVFVITLITITHFSNNKILKGKIDYDLNVKAYEDIIDKNQQLMKSYQEYLDKSIYMKIDPYHKPNLISKYYVKLDPKIYDLYKNPIAFDPANKVLDLYVAKLNARINWQKVMKLTNMELPYAKETISIWSDNNGFISTQVTFDDENVAVKLQDMLDKEIMGLHNEIQSDTYIHEIISVKQPVIYTVDTGLADEQKSYKNRINDCMNIIQNADTKLKKLKKMGSNHTSPLSSIPISEYIKYIIMDAFIAAFIVFIYYMLIYIFGGCIHIADDIRILFGFELISVIRKSKKDGRAFSFLDEYIYNNMKKTLFNDNETDAIKRVILYIESIKKDTLSDNLKIGIVSSCVKEHIREFIEMIPDEYKNDIVYIGNPKNSVDDSELVSEVDRVILVEALDTTKIIDVTMNVDIINMFKKVIIGYVLYA